MGGFTTGEMPVFMMSLYCWVCYKLIVISKQFNKVEQPALVYPSLTLIFNMVTVPDESLSKNCFFPFTNLCFKMDSFSSSSYLQTQWTKTGKKGRT